MNAIKILWVNNRAGNLVWIRWLPHGTVYTAGDNNGWQTVNEYGAGDAAANILQMDERHESVEEKEVEINAQRETAMVERSEIN